MQWHKSIILAYNYQMLRPITEVDIVTLVAIEDASQIAPWPDSLFKKCLEIGSIGWLIEENNQILGFIIILYQVDEVHILNLCIHPEHQQKGYGRQLLTYALNQIQQAGSTFTYLEVRKSNKPAINLYLSLGFKQIGERKNYYISGPDTEDALVFAKNLP